MYDVTSRVCCRERTAFGDWVVVFNIWELRGLVLPLRHHRHLHQTGCASSLWQQLRQLRWLPTERARFS